MLKIDFTRIDTAAFLKEMQTKFGSLFRVSDATEDEARKHAVNKILVDTRVDRIILHRSSVQLVLSNTLQREDLLALIAMRFVTADGSFEFSCLDSMTEEEPCWGGGDSTFVGYVVAEFSRA